MIFSSSNVVFKKAPEKPSAEDKVFDALVNAVNDTANHVIDSIRINDTYEPIPVRVNTKNAFLWDLFINNINEEHRQQYRCRSCKNFIDRYGNIVLVDRGAKVVSLLWDEEKVPPLFKTSVKAMREACESGKPMISSSGGYADDIFNGGNLGKIKSKYRTGIEYNHLYLDERIVKRLKHISINDYAVACAVLIRLGMTKKEHVESFVNFLNNDDLYGIEKYRWAASLSDLVKEINGPIGHSRYGAVIIKYAQLSKWKWAHFGASVIGEIFEGICNGNDFDTLKSRYNYLTDSIRYMRPTADVSDALVKEANRIFADMGITVDSLRRRPARLDELTYIWKEEAKEEKIEEDTSDKGVFDSLLSKNKKDDFSKFVTKERMSLNKFLTKILPDCDTVSLKLRDESGHLYSTDILYVCGVWFNTATVEDSAPILRWDLLDSRQPVSQYQIHDRIDPAIYIPLYSKNYIEVYGICYDCEYWKATTDPETVSSAGINFIFKNGTLVRDGDIPLSIFPSIVNPKFHSIRKVIEKYSMENILDPIYPEGSTPAVGVRINHGVNFNNTFVLSVHHKIKGYIDITITNYETE